MAGSRSRVFGALCAAIAVGSLCAAGAARAALDSAELSPDITLPLGAEVLGPEEVGRDDLSGGVTFTGIGVAVPIGVDVDAFERLPANGSDVLFSVDIPANIGGVFVGPADVARVTNGNVSVYLNGAANFPAGADLDALARLPNGDLLLSFDTTVALGSIVADDEDVVRVHLPAVTYSLYFDGSARGLPGSVDLDALDALVDGRLLLSLDTTGAVGAVTFSDEDALSFDPATNAFALEYDGSAEHAAWLAGDLDALEGSLNPDGDAFDDAADLCPFYVQAGSLDTDGDFRGNECECTDQTGDGRNNVADIVAINVAIFNPGQITALCDGTNDGLCNVGDIVAANIEIFSPSNTSICARQPFPGP